MQEARASDKKENVLRRDRLNETPATLTQAVIKSIELAIRLTSIYSLLRRRLIFPRECPFSAHALSIFLNDRVRI